MMSVPAINPVLPSSGNQPPKVGSSPPTGSPVSVTPIGLTTPPKISVIPPPQISSSPSKTGVAVNHSSIPLSLVHENKVISPPQQSPLGKSPAEKPKEQSPVKPTSNGVEASIPKTLSPVQTVQPSQTAQSAPVQAVRPVSPAQTAQPVQPAQPPAVDTANSKPDESKVEPPVTNHASDVKSTPNESEKTTPVKQDTAQNSKTQSQNKDAKPDQNTNQTPPKESESIPEAKLNEIAPSAPEPPTDSKPNKPETKAAPVQQSNKRKKEPKAEDKSEEPEPEKKPRRIRSQVLPYQSPLPEIATFIHKSLKEKDAAQKNNDEKLIVFYKNEFLAVRNAEGGFYLCQTTQNVYRSSHRIKIRWLSQDKEGNSSDGDIYTPDFYDHTDFECILTTVTLEKLDKNKYKLPKIELERTENILKRALDVEKGVNEESPLTEEHPDGLDLSLYKDESQLSKAKRSAKRKSRSPGKRSPKRAKKESDAVAEVDTKTKSETKKTKTSKSRSRTPLKKPGKTTPEKAKGGKKVGSRSESARERSSKAVDQLKVSPPNEKARVVAKVLRKIDIAPVQEVASKKPSKSKGGKKNSGSSKKSEKKNSKAEKNVPVPTTSTRSSERRGSATTSRKKTGKK